MCAAGYGGEKDMPGIYLILMSSFVTAKWLAVHHLTQRYNAIAQQLLSTSKIQESVLVMLEGSATYHVTSRD